MYKLLSIILLCLSVLSMNTAHANAQPKPDVPDGEIGDWRKTPGILRPAPGTINPSPTPKKVHVPFDLRKMGKHLGRAALPLVAYELLGAGVDYFLDPDNNRVVITPDYADCHTGPHRGSLLTVHRLECAKRDRAVSGTPKQFNQSRDGTYHQAYCVGGSDMTIICAPEPKTEVPLDELADRLIEAARRGNPDAKRWLEDWADAEIEFNPEPYRRQLDSTDPKINPNLDPNSQTNPSDNPSSEACQKGYKKDAEGVCVPDPDAIDGEEESPEEEPKPEDSECPLPKIVCDFIEWVQEKPEKTKDDGRINIDPSEANLDKVNINFGGSCPADSNFPFSIAGRQLSFSLSYQYICKLAVSMGGIVKILSTIVAMYILTGIK